MWNSQKLADLVLEAVDWRRHLHQRPELGFELEETARFVSEKLQSFGCDDVVTGLGRTGIVASIKGKLGDSVRSIALRADMDALPIQEVRPLTYRSTVPGRMHACGHDGHTSILLGAACHLARTRNFAGTVFLVFQPAEEGGQGGAKAMLQDGLFDRFPAHEVYGLHNWPGLPIGSYALRQGSLMASFDSFAIEVEGRSGHAATPHKAVDTVVTLSATVGALQSIVARNVDPLEPVVVSVCQIHAGEADNIIPQVGRISGSVRTLTAAASSLCEARMRSVAESTAAAYGATARLTYRQTIPAVINEPQAAAHLAEAAAAVVGAERVETNYPVQMGAEDFAEFANCRPGAFIFLGNGNTASLHNEAYDFCDDALPYGIALWTKLVETRLAA